MDFQVVIWPRFSGLVVSPASCLTLFQRSECRLTVVFGNFKGVQRESDGCRVFFEPAIKEKGIEFRIAGRRVLI